MLCSSSQKKKEALVQRKRCEERKEKKRKREKKKKSRWWSGYDLIETTQENGSHHIGFFTTLPLSFSFQNLKTVFSFQFWSLASIFLSDWVMKTVTQNSSKQSNLLWGPQNLDIEWWKLNVWKYSVQNQNTVFGGPSLFSMFGNTLFKNPCFEMPVLKSPPISF